MHFLKLLSLLVTAALASAVVIVPAAPSAAAHDLELTNPIGHIAKRADSSISLGDPQSLLLFTMSNSNCLLSADPQAWSLSSESGCIRMNIPNRFSVYWMRGPKHDGVDGHPPPCKVTVWSGVDCRGVSREIHYDICSGPVKYGSISWDC
ncbi:hypothetical protein QBC39DRAFT_353081 [Podospora conica]|nr:hypothetical protein QBC39DRAFT_353081 [Schizothecium conicum]